MGYRIGVYPKMNEPLDNILMDVITATAYYIGRKGVIFRKEDGGVEFIIPEPPPHQYVYYLLKRYDLLLDEADPSERGTGE